MIVHLLYYSKLQFIAYKSFRSLRFNFANVSHGNGLHRMALLSVIARAY